MSNQDSSTILSPWESGADTSEKHPTMTRFFPEQCEVHFKNVSAPIRILSFLGSGSQGQVYKVRIGDEYLALKWYYSSYAKRDRQLLSRLYQAISAGSPSDQFIWPCAVLREGAGKDINKAILNDSFGYAMPLRPDGYIGANEHYGGNLDISIQKVLIVCRNLCKAFHALHSIGFCYKDLSIGNIFFNPITGHVLVCDNDNVDVNGRSSGSVLGTPGFIAPEIILSRASPDRQTDLFSLANIIFRLLTRHDPFCGKKELSEPLLDEAARLRLYTENPVFIFDPNNGSNRPDPMHHSAVLTTWPIYINEIHDLFLRSFCEGVLDPMARVLTGEWIDVLSRILDNRMICTQCESENFLENHFIAADCWNCGSLIQPTMYLEINTRRILPAVGTLIMESHFARYELMEMDEVLGEIVAKPDDSRRVGMRNNSTDDWRGVLANNKLITVRPGQTCDLLAVKQIHTKRGAILIGEIKTI